MKLGKCLNSSVGDKIAIVGINDYEELVSRGNSLAICAHTSTAIAPL